MSIESDIRERVLRGLAMNRTPGYHYAGNFLDFSFEHVAVDDVRMRMSVGPHVAEANGNVNYCALAILADMGMAANIRAGHTLATRVATVQMNLQFTGSPMTGRLLSASRLQEYVKGCNSAQGAAEVTVSADGVPVCYGTGTFMVLEPPPGVALYSMSHRKETDPPIAPLAERELKRDEKKVLAIADAALAEMRAGGNFIKSFWGVKTHARHTGAGGAVGALNNSPHVGNRVGHLQGGVTMGLGVATAETALPANWMLSAVTAWYIRPGEGRVIKAKSKIIHQGRLTAVVRTEITGKNNKRVMEMITTHAHKSAKAA